MSRPGRTLIDRLAMTACAVMVMIAAGARSAAASGCHVPDRPALGLALSLDRASGLALPNPAGEPAPPILRRVPCSGEVPSMPVVSSALIGPALLDALAPGFPIPSQPIRTADVVVRATARALRLDRPPRRPASSVR